eukprot:3240874-Prymnesium_polylepis.1
MPCDPSRGMCMPGRAGGRVRVKKRRRFRRRAPPAGGADGKCGECEPADEAPAMAWARQERGGCS